MILNKLVEQAAADPGALFSDDALSAFAALKRDNPPAYMALRERLKEAGFRNGGMLDGYINKEIRKNKIRKNKVNQTTVMTRLALSGAELFRTPEGTGFAVVANATWPIRSKPFKTRLIEQYIAAHGRKPSTDALYGALSTLEGVACYQCPVREVPRELYKLLTIRRNFRR
jgi:hypothetical protein